MKLCQTLPWSLKKILSGLTGACHPPDVAQWLGTVGDDLHGKLSMVGLADARRSVLLADELEKYIKNHSGGKEPETIVRWKIDRDRIIGFFGKDKNIKDIKRSDCESYKSWLYNERHFADSTVGKAIRNARMFFTAWVRDGVLLRNPFDGVKGSNAIDESRNHYIKAETVKLATEYCPDAEWRAIFALARFGGLRPGEIYILKLDAIKWDRDKIIVTSPKTKRHVGGGQREIPIFPELRPYLLDVAESARDGAVYVLDRLRERATCKAKTPNLGKIVNDILEKAGIPKWTKPFVSMRGSAETDLAEVFPIKVVTTWIGNSPRVAQKHYLRVLPSHFDEAVKSVVLFDKKGNSETTSDPLKYDDLPLYSRAAKCAAAPAGNSLQINEATNKNAVNCGVLQSTASVCNPRTDPNGI